MTGKGSDRPSSSTSRKTADSSADDASSQKLLSPVALDFEELAQGQQCILIRLAGETYTLRKTQSGKLILNK